MSGRRLRRRPDIESTSDPRRSFAGPDRRSGIWSSRIGFLTLWVLVPVDILDTPAGVREEHVD